MLWKGCRWASKAGQVGFSSFHHGVVFGSVYMYTLRVGNKERERGSRR